MIGEQAEALHLAYLVTTGVLTLGLVAAFALLGLRRLPPELRRLRVLAVVLPSAFVIVVELALYDLMTHSGLADVWQHVLATVVLSGGAVPFSVYVFRRFAALRNELAERARRLETLHQISLAVTREPAVGTLAETIASGARAVAGADRATLQWTTQGPAAAASMLAGSTQGAPEGLLDDDAPAADPTRTPREGSTLEVTLNGPRGEVGVLTVSRSAVSFDPEDELLLDMFALAASAAVENARRLEETQLLATIEERERIARDLHDDLGQLLGFLTAKTQAIQELVARGKTARASEELAALETASRGLGTEVREAILGLRARVGPGRPLGEALADYLSDYGVLAGVETAFQTTPGAAADLPGPAAYQLLQITREALSNVRRHARARLVTVRLAETPQGLELSVTDDGVGIPESPPESGFGVQTMEERARCLGASFAVRALPGSGTLVRVCLPAGGG